MTNQRKGDIPFPFSNRGQNKMNTQQIPAIVYTARPVSLSGKTCTVLRPKPDTTRTKVLRLPVHAIVGHYDVLPAIRALIEDYLITKYNRRKDYLDYKLDFSGNRITILLLNNIDLDYVDPERYLPDNIAVYGVAACDVLCYNPLANNWTIANHASVVSTQKFKIVGFQDISFEKVCLSEE